MNKSKYFDMAGNIAASKLMPRPEVQVTISMQRGGGLGSLNEKPISSAYGRPIPRFIYREDGGPVIKRFGGGSTYTDADAGYPAGPVGDDYGFFEEAEVGPFTYTSPPALQDDPEATPPTTPIQLDIGTGKKGITKQDLINTALDIPGVSKAARYFGLIPTVPRTGQLPPSQLDKQRISNQLQDVPFFPSAPSIPPSGLLPPSQRRTTPVSSGGRGTDPRDFEDDETDDKPITSPAQAFMDDLLKVGGQRYGMKEGYKNSERLLNDSLRTGSVHSVLDAAKKGEWGQAAKGLIVPPELSDIRDREIRLMGDRPSYKYKHGGGLSNLNKSIKINGQPHSLAWIRPDEASALRAMGGSGKKVKGIPAYFGFGGWGTEDTGGSDIGGEGQYAEATGDVAGDPYTYDERGVTTGGPTGGTVTQYAPSDKDYAAGADLPDWAWGADEKGIKLVGPGKADSRGDVYFRGEGYDDPGYYRDQNIADKIASLFMGRSTTEPLFMARTIKDEQLDTVNLVQTSMMDAVKKTQAQSPGMRSAQRGGEKTFDEKETEKETNESVLEAAKEHMTDVGASFLNVPWFAPGSILASIANGIGRAAGVIGTGKIGDVSYYIYGDGTINEMPLQGEYEDEGNIVEDKRSPRPIREVASVSETVEEDVAPAKGTMKELLSRRGPTSKSGLASLQNIFEKSYGRPFKTGLG